MLRQEKDHKAYSKIIDTYLLGEDLDKNKMFVHSISDLRSTIIVSMIQDYIREREIFTVEDIIKNHTSCMFEFNNETYVICEEDGIFKFRTLGSPKIISNPPFGLQDVVRRLF